MADAMDVRKQKDLSGFYKHLLRRQVGEESLPEDRFACCCILILLYTKLLMAASFYILRPFMKLLLNSVQFFYLDFSSVRFHDQNTTEY